MVRIRIPATVANLGVLFDKGGIAIDAFHNTIELSESEDFNLEVSGTGKGILPEDKSNLVNRAIEYFYNQTGRPVPALSIKTINGIPLSRGLGSSGACIAGGIYAANELEGHVLSDADIILMAAEMEGHGDNVCSAVSGGITVFSGDEFTRYSSKDEPGLILFIPESTLETKKSRGILPERYDVSILNLAKDLENSMVKALSEGDFEQAGALMELDIIHQPYRKDLLPYWDHVIEAAEKAGVWGTALSGAGPSMFSICKKDVSKKIAEELKKTIAKEFKINIIVCGIDARGIVHDHGD